MIGVVVEMLQGGQLIEIIASGQAFLFLHLEASVAIPREVFP